LTNVCGEWWEGKLERFERERIFCEEEAVGLMTVSRDETAFRTVQLKFLAAASAKLLEMRVGAWEDGKPNEKFLKFHQASNILFTYPSSIMPAPSH
jgi:hypothetical protein